MVWFFVNSVPGICSQKCGNLLSDIANGIRRHNPAPSNTSVFTNGQFNLPNANSDLINPFNFSQFHTPGFIPTTDLISLPGSAYNTDLINIPTNYQVQALGASLSSAADLPALPNSEQIATLAAINNPGSSIIKAFENIGTQVSTMWNNFKTGVKNIAKPIIKKVSEYANELVNYASSFVGRVNSDREGNSLFSGGHNRAWCADFVTYCVKKAFGGKLPSDFGSPAVSGLREWGIKHGCYTNAPASRTESNMRNYLKTQVKPGDIMIQKRNGRSHTGIVQSVSPDGSSYTVVEGNASNKVKTVTYNATNGYLSGFVSLSNFA